MAALQHIQSDSGWYPEENNWFAKYVHSTLVVVMGTEFCQKTIGVQTMLVVCTDQW